MSTTKKYVMTLLMVAFAAFCMTGCGGSSEEKKPINVVIVGGIRANQPSINVTKVEELVEKAAGSAGTVSIISVEGEPRAIATIAIPAIARNVDPSKQKSLMKGYTEQIMAVVEQSEAITEEADCLSAIQLAARQLNAGKGEKYLIVMDNGLSTTGSIDLTKASLANIDVGEIIENLKQNDDIPSLKDVPVYWAGLGQCAGVQKALLNKEYNRLTELWTKILEEGGASVNILTDIASGNQAREDLPSVKTVAVSEPVSILAEEDNSKEVVEKTIKIQKSEITIDEETASFQPNSAKLRSSEKKLKTVLLPIAEYLQSDSSNQIVLIATTASAGNTSGDDSDSVKLSQKRGETMKKLILSFGGIRSSQIQTVGLGYQKAVKADFAIKDVDSNGNFVENKGALNRQVIITDVDSERGKAALALK